jgi:hypothetical protein
MLGKYIVEHLCIVVRVQDRCKGAGCRAQHPQQQPGELDPILPAGEQAGHQVLHDFLQCSMTLAAYPPRKPHIT